MVKIVLYHKSILMSSSRRWSPPVNHYSNRRRRLKLGICATVITLMAIASPTPVSASGSTISFFVSPPGVEGPRAITGLTIETFNSLTGGSKGAGTSLAVGSITSGSLMVDTSAWAGAVTTTDTPYPTNFTLPISSPNTNYPYADKTNFAYPSSTVVIALTEPVNYLGLYWAAGSDGNTLKLRSGGTVVATFSSNDLMDLIPTSTSDDPIVNAIGGATYDIDHYEAGHKNIWDGWRTPPRWSEQPFAYIHAVAPSGITFDSVELISSQFEFDNLAIANYTGTFNATGYVGVPLVASTTTTFNTVTFNANDGSADTTSQSALPGSQALHANPFTRAGFTFRGWSTSPTGSVDYTDGASYGFAANLTLHALWTGNPTPATPVAPAPETTTTTVAPPSLASPPTPTLEAPRRVRGGSVITVVARGFTPGESVQMSVGDSGKTRTVIADTNGEVRLTVRLTTNEDGERVLAQAVAGSRKVTQEIQIADSPATLPSTGASTTIHLFVSGLMCLLGAVLVTRRRWDKTRTH